MLCKAFSRGLAILDVMAITYLQRYRLASQEDPVRIPMRCRLVLPQQLMHLASMLPPTDHQLYFVIELQMQCACSMTLPSVCEAHYATDAHGLSCSCISAMPLPHLFCFCHNCFHTVSTSCFTKALKQQRLLDAHLSFLIPIRL